MSGFYEYAAFYAFLRITGISDEITGVVVLMLLGAIILGLAMFTIERISPSRK